MEDFDLLEEIIDAFLREDGKADACQHAEKRIDEGVYVCLKCGFSEKVNDGQTYTSHKMYKRSSRSTSISVCIHQKGFDNDIVLVADKIYSAIIDENSKRTGNRSSIICACIFQALKFVGRPIDYAHVYSKFNIKKKSALKGLKFVNTEIAKKKTFEFYDVISSPVSPENFITAYLSELKAPEESVSEVIKIYEAIKEDAEIGMSRPQSIAAGVIFYWLKNKGMTDAMKIIEQKANLSQITISKKAKTVQSRIEEGECAHK